MIKWFIDDECVNVGEDPEKSLSLTLEENYSGYISILVDGVPIAYVGEESGTLKLEAVDAGYDELENKGIEFDEDGYIKTERR